MVGATTSGGDDVIELISMWVAPFARGHGVGDAAIRRVLAWHRLSRAEVQSRCP
jgi:GNAT superfamily N-acetyltransferase